MVYAEAISFKLAETMSRLESREQVKRLRALALEKDCSLQQLLIESYPDTDRPVIATPAAQLGDAVQHRHARLWGWPGHVIDVLAVFATLFGLAVAGIRYCTGACRV